MVKNIIASIFICFSFMSFAWAQGKVIPMHLSLRQALSQVDSINLQVLMANARVDQAIARISQAQSDLLPHVDGLVDGARQTTDMRYQGIQFPEIGPHIGPYNNFDARGRISISLFDPAAFERLESAKKGEQLSAAQLQKTREDILALVAQLYIDAQRKQQTVNLFQILINRDEMSFALSKDKLHQGTGTELDLNKFKSGLDQTRFVYAQAKLQAKEALLDLKAALQIPLNRPLVLDDDMNFEKSLTKLSSPVNVDNADVIMAKTQLQARNVDQKTAMADFLPKISGLADYGRLGESPDHGSNTYSVGLTVTVPIWDGGLQEANLKEAKGQVKEAQENLQDSIQQEAVNIAKAHEEIIEASELKVAQGQEKQTLQRSLEIAQHALAIGTGSRLAVLQAKADLALAQDNLNEANATWILGYIDLLHAQGQLRQLIKTGE